MFRLHAPDKRILERTDGTAVNAVRRALGNGEYHKRLLPVAQGLILLLPERRGHPLTTGEGGFCALVQI